MSEIDDLWKRVELAAQKFPDEKQRIENFATRAVTTNNPRAIKLFDSLIQEMIETDDVNKVKQMLNNLESLIAKLE